MRPHAAGVVPVDAKLADILISSCYKWLLGTHGAAVFYWNRERLPDLQPPFLGWANGITHSSWEDPTAFTPRPNADRFEPGNPSFISIYLLENGLDHLMGVGIDTIEEYVLSLSGRLWHGIHDLGWEMMTPAAPEDRAGNVCFMTPNVETVVDRLQAKNIVIWGSYGGIRRVRASTHLYNTEADVDAMLEVMRTIPTADGAA